MPRARLPSRPHWPPSPPDRSFSLRSWRAPTAPCRSCRRSPASTCARLRRPPVPVAGLRGLGHIGAGPPVDLRPRGRREAVLLADGLERVAGDGVHRRALAPLERLLERIELVAADGEDLHFPLLHRHHA